MKIIKFYFEIWKNNIKILLHLMLWNANIHPNIHQKFLQPTNNDYKFFHKRPSNTIKRFFSHGCAIMAQRDLSLVEKGLCGNLNSHIINWLNGWIRSWKCSMILTYRIFILNHWKWMCRIKIWCILVKFVVLLF